MESMIFLLTGMVLGYAIGHIMGLQYLVVLLISISIGHIAGVFSSKGKR